MLCSDLVYRIREAFAPKIPNGEQLKAAEVFAQFMMDRTSDRTVMVLRGSAGTGKTTLAAALVKALGTLGQKLMLLAPTGRAAKRLSEAAGQEAKTSNEMPAEDISSGNAAEAPTHAFEQESEAPEVPAEVPDAAEAPVYESESAEAAKPEESKAGAVSGYAPEESSAYMEAAASSEKTAENAEEPAKSAQPEPQKCTVKVRITEERKADDGSTVYAAKVTGGSASGNGPMIGEELNIITDGATPEASKKGLVVGEQITADLEASGKEGTWILR